MTQENDKPDKEKTEANRYEKSVTGLLSDTPTAISNIWVACIRVIPFFGDVLYLSNLTAAVMSGSALYKEIEFYADAKGGLLVINQLGVNNRIVRHLICKAAVKGSLMVEASNQADLDYFVKSVAPRLGDDSVYEKCFDSIDQVLAISRSLAEDTNKLVVESHRDYLDLVASKMSTSVRHQY